MLNNPGTENPFKLWRELGDVMSRNVTVTRYNDKLQETDAKLVELLERYRNVNLNDKSMWSNQSFLFTGQLYNMLQLARVITQGASCVMNRADHTISRTSPSATTRIF